MCVGVVGILIGWVVFLLVVRMFVVFFVCVW